MRRAALSILCIALIATGVQAAELVRHTVESAGHPIAVWEKSPDSPRAIMLLVHGRTWSTLPDFDLQVEDEELSLMDGLVEANIATYGIDLRGYGATPRDDSGWHTPDQAVVDVVAVLRWLSEREPALAKPYLFGWSYGSMVSQLVVQRHPDLVSGVVLFGYPVRPGGNRRPQVAAPQEGAEPARLINTAQAAASDFVTPGSISDRAVAAFVRAALANDPVRVDWRELTQWLALSAPAVTVPTLLLEGEFDPLALDDVHSQLFANLGTKDKTWAVIPGGDHAAFMETPRPYFLQMIQNFIFRGR